MMEWTLSRTRQCKKCPWKTSTNPLDIPDDYSIEAHRNLAGTISDGTLKNLNELRIMACHESLRNEPVHCVGWIYNQLNEGNNIALRIRMLSCTNAHDLEIVEEQHDNFEDTLPKL